MIITRKSELNKLINKRSDSTHQKKISSKRVEINGDLYSKGTFTVKGPNKMTECYKRDGSICDSQKVSKYKSSIAFLHGKNTKA